ncbi:MAG: sigma-70 family RNA polymerase sigma factor [Sphingobium sp.]
MLEEISSMRRYARALTRDDSAADDVVQDALLKALEKRHTFRPGGSRRRWLLAIVHNIFISARRRAQAEERRNARFAETLADRLEPDQEHGARLREIARGFAALPDTYRAVLHLVAVEGQSYQEAAAILDIPIGTVMSRLSRARAALRHAHGEGSDGHDVPAVQGVAQDRRGLRIIGGRDAG